jgi:hypothetical protein
MSTFGREADRLAEQARKRERRAAQDEIKLADVVRFAIATLADKTLPNDIARPTALDALRLKEVEKFVTLALGWYRARDALLGLADTISAQPAEVRHLWCDVGVALMLMDEATEALQMDAATGTDSSARALAVADLQSVRRTL